MTDWNERAPGAYITGIKFSVQNKMPANTEFVKLNSVRLLERYKEPDTAVESAVEQLTMSALTNTPGAVTSNLKTLPVSKPGVSITWRSSRPDLINDAGALVGVPALTTDVVITASVRNTEDGYTQNLDFRLTVPPRPGFEETYTGTFTGTPSSAESEGTKTFEQLPMWEFSYPGIFNGTDGEIHTAQVLQKNNYLVFKKLSAQQTVNNEECLVGLRSLSDIETNPQYSAAAVSFTAKAAGTGTMQFAPVTIAETPVCTVILNASDGHIESYTARNRTASW